MTTTRVFQNGNSQAVRIPRELRTEETEFFIQKHGDVYVLFPKNDPWLPLRQVIGSFPEDFLDDREQPTWDTVEERETL